MQNIHKEDYLRAMYHLAEENQEIKSVDVASYLGVSKASVSEMLKSLDSLGFLEYRRYARIQLTKKGREAAQNLTARHRIIETFLRDMLKISERKIHDEAHNLEHAFSDESILRLNRLLGNPRLDPHGKPIPKLM